MTHGIGLCERYPEMHRIESSIDRASDRFQTIYDVVRYWADHTPTAPAFLAADRPPTDYSTLIRAVDQIGTELAACGVRRCDRIAIAEPGGTDVAITAVGVWSHAAAVPLNPNFTDGELALAMRDLGVKALAVTDPEASPARSVARQLGLPVLTIFRDASAEAYRIEIEGDPVGASGPCEPAQADDPVLILATSGTTSHSKIVPLLQRQLLARGQLNARFLELTPADRALNLMPLFHGGGLSAGIATCLFAGSCVCPLPALDAETFYHHLEALAPTYAMGAPTVFSAILDQSDRYQTAIAKARPNLRMIRTGAGKLDTHLSSRLEETFGAPVIQVYGSSESGWMACDPLTPESRKPGSVGLPRPNEVAVFDEDGQKASPGAVGEIGARGVAVFDGYDNGGAPGAPVFIDGWYRTGDAGYIDGDGYLFLTGRLNEIINRGGQKITPDEIDAALLSHPAVRAAAAFPIAHATLGEEIAATVVANPDASADEQTLLRYLRERLAPYKIPRRIVFADDIPKGPTGKVQRHKLAEFLGLSTSVAMPDRDTAEQNRPATPLEETLRTLWAKSLGLECVGLHDDFFMLGGDSLQAVNLFLDIERHLGRRLPRAILFESATVAEIAACIEAELPSRCLVPIQPNGNRPPFFCVHDQDGQVLNFRALAQHLGEQQPFYGLQARGLDGDEIPFTDADAMAAHYIQEIRRVQPDGPFLLGGYSFGGRIAYLMAQQLRTAGEEVPLLALFDTYYQGGKQRASIGRWIQLHFQRLTQQSPSRMPAYLARRIISAWEVFAVAVRTTLFIRAWRYYANRSKPVPRLLRNPSGANDIISSNVTLAPYDGHTVLFKAELPALLDPEVHNGWRKIVRGDLETRPIPGRHSDVMIEPMVCKLAAELNDCIETTFK
jgi:oxalate---CoA ligase